MTYTYVPPGEVAKQLGKPSLADDPRVIRVTEAASLLVNDWCGYDKETPAWPDPVPGTIAEVTLSLAVDLWKQPDATFGMLGSAETGMVRVARDLQNRYDSLLIPYYNGSQAWGVG